MNVDDKNEVLWLVEHIARVKRGLLRAFGKDERLIWKTLLRGATAQWDAAKQSAQDGPHVLLATSLGDYQMGILLESALAVALTLRGARVDILLCDRFLPACQSSKIQIIPPYEFVEKGPERRCRSCFTTGTKFFESLGLTIHRYSDFVEPEQVQFAQKIAEETPIDQIGKYRFNGLSVGEHAEAGALRFFARGDLENEPTAEATLRRYLEASILSVFTIQELLQKHTYDVACFHHGIYVPQGLIGEVCRQQAVRVVNWNPSYRKNTFIFSHNDSYHHTMISEPTSDWENIDWTSETEAETLAYLKSRWQGTEDWIWFHESPQEEISKIEQETGVDFSRPSIGLLTNVMWDAQLHYKSNAFKNILEWVLQTIEHFKKRPELQLLIRVHPAEIRGLLPSRQPLVPEIRFAYPVLPPNVFVVPPESKVSTYAAMERCDSVIIYNTKSGIEIASMGIPVIVAGEAWIRNKGFSLDASSPEEYFNILDKLPLMKKMDSDKIERARKYAYHFFFRRMIPLPFITSSQKYKFAVQISDLEELLQGHYPGLDIICDGILQGKPFIYHVERFQ